ncbi:MAG TPA: hypothetical protein VE091_13175 [Gemmatimonadales bacterium]|nr:hypothetical protein [Gemmatimonadales bacterium]
MPIVIPTQRPAAPLISLGLYPIAARLGDRFGSLKYTAFGRKPVPVPAAD